MKSPALLIFVTVIEIVIRHWCIFLANKFNYDFRVRGYYLSGVNILYVFMF
jgi:hypothetical protein